MTTTVTTRGKLENEELKDAYQAWLKDLHDDKSENLLNKLKKKKHSGGKTRRKLRLQHAQQHTAVSSLKDVALKKSKLPALYVSVDKQVVYEAQRRRHQVLVDEANYSGVQYLQPSWRPGLAFFQQLVHCVLQKGTNVDESGSSVSGVSSSELSHFPVRIAPILLRVPLSRLGNRLGVALLYCQEPNQVEHLPHGNHTENASFVLVCRVYSQEKIWREHQSALVDIISNPSTEICAVRKRADAFESRYNDLEILRTRQEVQLAIEELWIDSEATKITKNDSRSDRIAVQKYIPFKGAANNDSTVTSSAEPPAERKAWIARCASRKRDKRSSTVWIISGGNATDSKGTLSSMVTNSSSTNCQLIKCTIDQAWSEPRLVASMCLISLEKALQVRLNELVVDLLQDSSGNWWLLQVKSFSLGSIRPVSASTLSTSSLLSTKVQRGLSRTQSAPNQFEATPQWRKWRCAGRYCTKLKKQNSLYQKSDANDDANEPPGFLTKKVVRSCEFYDDFVRHQDMSLAGGFTEFPSALAFHLQHRLPKRDRTQLYEPQPLCSVCLGEYHSLRQQWTQTIGNSQFTISKTRKKGISKLFNEQVDQTLQLPRQLPSLHHDSASSLLYSSYSAPVIPTTTSKLQKLSKCVNKSTYLDELEAMEEMLSQHESLVKTTHTVQTGKLPPSSVTSTTTLASSSKDFFPKWDGETRIEAMWQNLSLKPLAKQPTSPLDDKLDVKNSYNSISLQQTTNERNQQENALKNEKKQTTDTKVVRTLAIPIQHCRRVFEDEMYREQLTSKALNALQSGEQNVCFVVTSPTSYDKQQPGDEDELAEMALRSLYLDVKQAIFTSKEIKSEVQLSSWPTRPTVHHEASGCMTVILGST